MFLSLTTDEEKERFIEQFRERRNPEPRSGRNPFKEEHYRRMAYANERFTAGKPGWMTDRGRIYIKYGEPNGLERRPAGGTCIRPITEGGGTTTVHPYEKWRYNYIEGVGQNIEIEFVDEGRTGDYRIALSPQQVEQFALGEIKVVPNLGRAFPRGDIVGVHLKAYGASIDEMAARPSLSTRYHVMQGGRAVRPPIIDDVGRTVRFVSDKRVVLVTGLGTDSLEPGSYRLLVKIRDNISGNADGRRAQYPIRPITKGDLQKRKLMTLLGWAALATALALPCFVQTISTSMLTGTVKDATGGVIPGAELSLRIPGQGGPSTF